jgi:hypothetical protein
MLLPRQKVGQLMTNIGAHEKEYCQMFGAGLNYALLQSSSQGHTKSSTGLMSLNSSRAASS